MKFSIKLAILLFILFSQACSTKKRTGETQSKMPTSQGLIEVTAAGYGTSKSGSVENAIENAFKNILIQGIPNSNQKRPLLGNNALSIFQKNKSYFDIFFTTEVSKYILNQKVLKYNPLAGNQASSEVLLEINLDALRRKLGNDNIITPFGI